jgi:hypothetical protein
MSRFAPRQTKNESEFTAGVTLSYESKRLDVEADYKTPDSPQIGPPTSERSMRVYCIGIGMERRGELSLSSAGIARGLGLVDTLFLRRA